MMGLVTVLHSDGIPDFVFLTLKKKSADDIKGCKIAKVFIKKLEKKNYYCYR